MSKKTDNNYLFKCLFIILAIVWLSIFSLPSHSIENIQEQTNSTKIKFTSGELAQILSPIALYPDVILSHIFIAATYPLEVIAVERWLEKHEHLTEKALIKIAQQKDWDESVKVLVKFPAIIKRLSADLIWMQNLGNAFLQDQEQTLSVVQLLRQQAEDAGNLDDMDNIRIVREERTIIIKPVQPEVIYIPYYDTRTIYGTWYWSHRPIYWHRPVNYVHYHSGYYWHSPVHIHLGWLFSNIHWHKRHVVVHHHKPYKYHSSKRRSTSHAVKKWQHKSRHGNGYRYRAKKHYPHHKPRKTTAIANKKRKVKYKEKKLIEREKRVRKRSVIVAKQVKRDKINNVGGKRTVNKRKRVNKVKRQHRVQSKQRQYKHNVKRRQIH